MKEWLRPEPNSTEAGTPVASGQSANEHRSYNCCGSKRLVYKVNILEVHRLLDRPMAVPVTFFWDQPDARVLACDVT